MKTLTLIALALAAAGVHAAEIEIGSSESDGTRFTLDSGYLGRSADDSYRLALVWSYGSEGRKAIKFLVEGCAAGYGRVFYAGLESSAEPTRGFWRRGGPKIFDTTATMVCQQQPTTVLK